jgi:hypothetical protein
MHQEEIFGDCYKCIYKVTLQKTDKDTDMFIFTSNHRIQFSWGLLALQWAAPDQWQNNAYVKSSSPLALLSKCSSDPSPKIVLYSSQMVLPEHLSIFLQSPEGANPTQPPSPPHAWPSDEGRAPLLPLCSTSLKLRSIDCFLIWSPEIHHLLPVWLCCSNHKFTEGLCLQL